MNALSLSRPLHRRIQMQIYTKYAQFLYNLKIKSFQKQYLFKDTIFPLYMYIVYVL